MNTPAFDIVIIGGGIAGLWTLASARARGYNAILLEKHALGQGQTVASQGIIHGGSKYALAGSISRATSMISDMPATWRTAIDGHGEFDLPGIRILSDTQYLIPSSGIDTQLLSFLGSRNMASHTEKVARKALPAGYPELGIQRAIFRLNELVLDVQTLLQAFRQQAGDAIYQASICPEDIQPNNDAVYRYTIKLPVCKIQCAFVVMACGEGNAAFGSHTVSMQTRPLHMVMMKGKSLPRLCGHFIGRSTKPVLTVTSHPTTDQQTVWYMGGDLAENGVEKTEAEQIDITRQLLKKLLPGLTLDASLVFATHRISRAEPAQATLTRPDDAFISNHDNIISGWPTKLALAPRFAARVLEEIRLQPGHRTPSTTPLALQHPPVASFPWQHL